MPRIAIVISTLALVLVALLAVGEFFLMARHEAQTVQFNKNFSTLQSELVALKKSLAELRPLADRAREIPVSVTFKGWSESKGLFETLPNTGKDLLLMNRSNNDLALGIMLKKGQGGKLTALKPRAPSRPRSKSRAKFSLPAAPPPCAPKLASPKILMSAVKT